MDEPSPKPLMTLQFLRGIAVRIVFGAVLMAAVYWIISVYATHQRERQIAGRTRIEPEALSAIDYDNIEEPVRNFIELAKAHKTIGQPASNFAPLLALAFKSETLNGRTQIVRYEFVLPDTEDAKKLLEGDHGTLCWPMLAIELDAKTQTIRSVRIYIQCW